jgi:ubiquinone/menaquinone biosynthesis C-methylase UbiE
VDDSDHASRAASFGDVAEVYDATRPDYPLEAIHWIVGPPPAKVVDAGAGTGKLTRVLLAAGYEVIAVEPSEPMLDRLRAASPGVTALQGSGESLLVGDASADAVTYGQAWHWVDPTLASAEAARVLCPGGVLGLVWNLRRTDDPVGAALAELIGGEDTFTSYAPLDIDGLNVGQEFGRAERTTFQHEQTLTREGLLGLVQSRSYIVLMPEDVRAPLLERVGAMHDDLAVDGLVTVKYETTSYRARLL